MTSTLMKQGTRTVEHLVSAASDRSQKSGRVTQLAFVRESIEAIL